MTVDATTTISAVSGLTTMVPILVALVASTGTIIVAVVKTSGRTNDRIHKIENKLDIHIAKTQTAEELMSHARKGFEKRCSVHTEECEKDRQTLHIGLERLTAKVDSMGRAVTNHRIEL